MKLSTNILIFAMLLLATIACKDTKTEEENSVAKATIEKVEAVESELETITLDLEKKAEELENSLNALDDI